MTKKIQPFLYVLLPIFAVFSIVAGLFASGSVKWPPQLFLSDAGFNDIVIHARGTSGDEKVALYVNNQPVQFWSLSTSFQDYTYAPPRAITVNQLSIEFLNDRWEPQNGINYDAQVDYITVNGTRYDSEHSSTASTGTWDQGSWCAPGNKSQEWLHCSGSFTYNIPAGTVVGIDPPANTHLPATINGFSDGQEIAGDSIQFTYVTEGDPDQARIYAGVGTRVNAETGTITATAEYHDTGKQLIADPRVSSPVTISGLPQDGSTVYVTVATEKNGSSLQVLKSFVSRSADVPSDTHQVPVITSPSATDIIDGATATLTYRTVGNPGLVRIYAGGGTRVNAETGTTTSTTEYFETSKQAYDNASVVSPVTITGLPQDGSVVYLTVASEKDGASLQTLTSFISKDNGGVAPPAPVCGNGSRESGEQCDDGNTQSGDGCSNACQTETVSNAVCGNGQQEAGEQCDDGNTALGDGCSSICTVEVPNQNTGDVKWGFWGEDRNAYSGGGFVPEPDAGVETFFENYSFAHTKAMNKDWVNNDTNNRAYVVNILNAAESTNTSLDIQLGSSGEYGWNFSTGRGNFNINNWKDMVSKFGKIDRPAFNGNGTIEGDPAAHAAIIKAINNGTIKYFFLIDEPNHPRWSPQWNGLHGGASTGSSNYVTNAHLDEMAAWIKTVFSEANQPINSIVRTSAMNLAVGRGGLYDFQHMTHSYFTISSTKWVSANPGNNKGLEWWMTEKDNFFNGVAELGAYSRQNLKMSMMVQAGFESKGNPWTSSKNFASEWWQGDIQYPYNGVTSYIKAAPGEMDYWIKSMLSPRNPATGVLDPNGQRLIDDFVIFRADRLPTDSGKLPWQRSHYRDFLSQLRTDINNNNLTPIVDIPVGWNGS